MAVLEVRPLTVVREHAGGFVSVYPVSAPRFVTHADDVEDAMEELGLFLSEYLARLDADAVASFVIAEDAEVRDVPVLVPRADLPRQQGMKTPIAMSTLVLPAEADARWVLIPALSHAMYVPSDQHAELNAIVEREVKRLALAHDLDAFGYLDLLPTPGLELARRVVKIEPKTPVEARQSRRRREEIAARKLLESVGRKVTPEDDVACSRDVSPLMDVLGSATRSGALLVGPAGSGKSTFFRAALAKLAKLDKARPVYATSGAELVAGQSMVGQLEDRIERVMRATELLDAVLYFEELDDLFAGRPGGYEDVAGLMQRFVEQGRVRLLGELTLEDHDRLSHRHVAFFAHLPKIVVPAYDRHDAIRVLKEKAESAARAGLPHLTSEAMSLVVDLVERYDRYRALPGKAVALLDDVTADRRANPRDDDSLELSSDDVLGAVAARTGVPEFLLRDERSMSLDTVTAFFEKRLIGQATAIRHVAETLTAVKAGLSPAAKPLATFLFVGPTGVGKTELAKALARFLFGSSDRMARFDMSEYADPLAAERLIRGTDRDDGVLTRRIREQPFSVLLLDEIEKADSAVFDLLLSVLGEGRLSDARGKVAHFGNAIVIMTSNLGAQHGRVGLGFADSTGDESAIYLGEVRNHFRPEFVNRLDRVIVFESLTREQIHRVARISLDRVAERSGFEERGIELVVSPEALAHLSEQGFSRAYGARGLRRHLEQWLMSPAAALIARLGGDADGHRLEVNGAAEPFAGESGDVLGEELRAGLAFRMLRRSRRVESIDLASVLDIGTLRRDVRRWLLLPELAEMRERMAEIQVQLNLGSGNKRQRRRAPQGRALGELSLEYARLRELLQPLDDATRELEDIESLVVTELTEGESPEILLPDAKVAHRRFRQALVDALVAHSDAHEISFIVQELDSHGGFKRLLPPLFAWIAQKPWQAVVHLDRGARKPTDEWPPVSERRFGPPIELNVQARRLREGASVQGPLLLRVKGQAAGMLLPLLAGRHRYQLTQPPAEVLFRVFGESLAFSTDDWKRTNEETDLRVAKRQPVRLDFEEAGANLVRDKRHTWFEGLSPDTLFERHGDVFFDEIVAAQRSDSERDA